MKNGWSYGVKWLPVLGLVAICVAAWWHTADAKPPVLPAYLQTATFKTSAKCKMCHKAEFTAWSATKHAPVNGLFPWEAAKDAKAPGPEDIYRHAVGFDAKANTWAEKGVACEACHGPGSEHMMAKKEERKAKIIDPVDLPTPTQQLSICGRCHGQYVIGDKKYAANFQVGQDLFETDGFKLDAVKPGGQMQQLNEFVTSDHMKKGVTCSTCHTAHAVQPLAHNLRKPVTELCTQCHKDIAIDTHAPNRPKDATCATCHMAGGRHDFKAPGH